MARTGRGASGGPRGRLRSSPRRRHDWPKPCASSVKQVGSWRLARSARRGASPKAVERARLGRGLRWGALRAMGLVSWRPVPVSGAWGPAQRDARRLGGILGGDKKQSGGTLELGRRAERELGMVSQCGDPGLLSAGVRA